MMAITIFFKMPKRLLDKQKSEEQRQELETLDTEPCPMVSINVSRHH